MARVLAYVPDLLFGSKVVAMISAAGHDPLLVSSPAALALSGVDAAVVDLTADLDERLKVLGDLTQAGVPVLAFYSHVEVDVRRQAEAAGAAQVVPRSRMAREGADLVGRLLL